MEKTKEQIEEGIKIAKKAMGEVIDECDSYVLVTVNKEGVVCRTSGSFRATLRSNIVKMIGSLEIEKNHIVNLAQQACKSRALTEDALKISREKVNTEMVLGRKFNENNNTE